MDIKYIAIAPGKNVDDIVRTLNRVGEMAGVKIFGDTPAEVVGSEVIDGDLYTLYTVTFEKVGTTQ